MPEIRSQSARQADHPQKASVVQQPWHLPPRITPNFGKRKKIGPKSNLPQVLLHDNVSQEHILRAQISYINLEERRSSKLLEMHKKSFLVQQSLKQYYLRASGVHHISVLPDDVAEAYCGMRMKTQSPNQVHNQTQVTKPPVTANAVLDKPNKDSANSRLSNQSEGNISRYSRQDSLENQIVHQVPDEKEDEVVTMDNRIKSAYPASSADEKTFMTHNFRVRREKTLHGLRGSSPLRALKDPRYISLKRTLVPSSRPVDGYLQLSPSGQYVLRKYGTPAVDEDNMHELIRNMTMYRAKARDLDPVEPDKRKSRSRSSTAKSRRSAKVSRGVTIDVDRLVIHQDSLAGLDHVEQD